MKKIIVLFTILVIVSCNNKPTISEQMEYCIKEQKKFPAGTKGYTDWQRKFDGLVKWQEEHTGMKGLRNKQIEDSIAALKK